MQWIALTGINGFLGHNLALEFLGETASPLAPAVDAVVGSDLAVSLERANYRRLHSEPRFHFTLAKKLIPSLLAKEQEWGCPPLAVIHNGACSSTTETNPEVFRVLNLESSQRLFEYCTQKRIPFLYASSASVYGSGSEGFSENKSALSDYRPLNLYGKSKLDFDRWVLAQKARPPVWFGMRYFNVFGPFEKHKGGQASVFTWGRRQIQEVGEIRLYKSTDPDIPDGEQKRDFVSASDVTKTALELLRLALERPHFDDQGLFINVGRGVATSWLEIGRALFGALGALPRFEFQPMPEALATHYQNYTEADLSNLGRLGLDPPSTPLLESFTEAIEREERAGMDSTKA